MQYEKASVPPDKRLHHTTWSVDGKRVFICGGAFLKDGYTYPEPLVMFDMGMSHSGGVH